MSIDIRLLSGAAAVAAGLALASAAQAEILRLVTNWGTGSYSVARTLGFVEEFNNSQAAKDADLQIVHIGGPEAIPATEQLTGLSKGVFDLPVRRSRLLCRRRAGGPGALWNRNHADGGADNRRYRTP